MKVFIVHYKKLFERKIHILEQFIKHSIRDYEFIEIDRDEIKKDVLPYFEENYSKVLIAIALSHFDIYRKIAESKENQYALILEDDVILDEKFTEKLNGYLVELPTEFDMLFIGDGAYLHISDEQIIPNKHIYEKCHDPTDWGGFGATRCLDSYIVSKKGAITLCEYIQNLKYVINDPIDFWLNNVIKEKNMKVSMDLIPFIQKS
jgi:GR25 family glycosyltransferase involved in LPS biosynthesis